MAKKKAPKRKQAQDATIRNARASVRRDTALDVRVDALEARTKALEARMAIRTTARTVTDLSQP